MTEEELRAIEVRADAATPGPWTADDERYVDGTFRVFVRGTDDLIFEVRYPKWPEHAANLQFLLHVRADIPALIAEVRDLRVQAARAWDDVGRLRALVEQQQRDCEKLREHAATMTNERDQWQREAASPAGAGAILHDWRDDAR